MKSGFAKVQCTPPVGTMMMGFGTRDRDHGCEGVHDDIFVRALYLTHEGEQVLIMGYDMCFIGREDADRYKGAIGRKIDLLPRQILMNASHSHVGPASGTWAYADFMPPDRLYQRDLELATVEAACKAHDAGREATIWAGATCSKVPMNRRKKAEDGKFYNRPNPDGVVCDTLPICLLKDSTDKPICLLFSISCHPSVMAGFEISGEYPGAAMNRLDVHLGTACSLFLQGAGGNAKPCVIGEGADRWRKGTWEAMEEAGNLLAQEVIDALDAGLTKVQPEIRTASIEMTWPLQPSIGRSGYEALAEDPETDDLRRLWAKRQIELLDRGQELATAVTLTAHGAKLGQGLRLIALEGEAVAELGILMEKFYSGGVTFPLGYTDGTGLYLVTSQMLDEGGYEPESAHEYGLPAPLAKGMEDILTQTLEQLHERGIT